MSQRVLDISAYSIVLSIPSQSIHKLELGSDTYEMSWEGLKMTDILKKSDYTFLLICTLFCHWQLCNLSFC